jgi:hypothetical protein
MVRMFVVVSNYLCSRVDGNDWISHVTEHCALFFDIPHLQNYNDVFIFARYQSVIAHQYVFLIQFVLFFIGSVNIDAFMPYVIIYLKKTVCYVIRLFII